MTFKNNDYFALFEPFFKRVRKLPVKDQVQFFYRTLDGLLLQNQKSDASDLIPQKINAFSEMLTKGQAKGWDINQLHPFTGFALVHYFPSFFHDFSEEMSIAIFECLQEHGANFELKTKQGSTFFSLLSSLNQATKTQFRIKYEQHQLNKSIPISKSVEPTSNKNRL